HALRGRANPDALGSQASLVEVEVRLDSPEDVLREPAVIPHLQEGPPLALDQVLANTSVSLQRVLEGFLPVVSGERGHTARETRLVDLAEAIDDIVRHAGSERLDLLQPVEGSLRGREAGECLIRRPVIPRAEAEPPDDGRKRQPLTDQGDQ